MKTNIKYISNKELDGTYVKNYNNRAYDKITY